MTGSLLAADLAARLDPAVAFQRAMGSPAEPWQERALRSRARKQAMLCARQVGKSTTTGVLGAHTAIYTPGALVLAVSPTQRQSNELLAKIKAAHRALGRPVGIVADSEQELRLENGSRVLSLPGTESTTRGFSAVDLLLLDEAAWIKDDTYRGVLPMVSLSGRIVALSTPGARVGWFYDAWTEDERGWERHTITCHESAQYPPERIAELKSSMSRRAFGAEYECKFTGINDAVFDPDKVDAALSSGRGIDLAALIRHGAIA